MTRQRRSNPAVPDGPRSYVISVSFGKGSYRHILISGNETLRDLHDVIMDELDFWDVIHLHGFFMDNNMRDSYYGDWDGSDPEGRNDSDYRLNQLGLYKGRRFLYMFDFGAGWKFQCRVLEVLDEDCRMAVVVQSRGKPPEQLEAFPDEEDEDEDEDDLEETTSKSK